MKGMVRLALSSYALLAGAAAPALARQDTALPVARVSSARRPLGYEGSAPSAPAAPTGRAAGSTHLPLASSAAGDTLAVSVQGPTDVPSPSVVPYRAALGNVASGSRYYFWWFAANCARRTVCAPTSYVLVAEGEGRDSVTVTMPPGSAERNVVVQVAELDGRGRTGSSPMFSVNGPARRPGSRVGASGKPSCDWYAGSFYPHSGAYTDPYTGQTWTRKFRRDYCGNQVRWDPEG